MDNAIWALEYVFLWSSTLFITIQAFQIATTIGVLYLCFVLGVWTSLLKLRPTQSVMVFAMPLSIINSFLYFTIMLSKFAYGAAYGVEALASGTMTTFAPIFTVPASADNGQLLIANIYDLIAVDAQTVCPGYVGSNVVRNSLGMTATLTLAGKACNVYGTDIETLSLTVQYQSGDRLSVKIIPAYIGASNTSEYILPSTLVQEPVADSDAETTSLTNDLSFLYSNEPTFSFSVFRKSTGDTLFSTMGTKLVFENQFIEFATSMPENYNLYGLGETIHGFRLGNNYTRVNIPEFISRNTRILIVTRLYMQQTQVIQ